MNFLRPYQGYGDIFLSLLDQETSSLGQVIDSSKIVNIPLNGRSPMRLSQETVEGLKRVELPNGVQPDQLSSAEINILIDPANWTS